MDTNHPDTVLASAQTVVKEVRHTCEPGHDYFRALSAGMPVKVSVSPERTNQSGIIHVKPAKFETRVI